MKKIGNCLYVFVLLTFCFFLLTGCSSSSSSSSSSSESRNRCGDTTDEHFAKTRKCNAKDNEKQNCEYSNCQCTCRPR